MTAEGVDAPRHSGATAVTVRTGGREREAGTAAGDWEGSPVAFGISRFPPFESVVHVTWGGGGAMLSTMWASQSQRGGSGGWREAAPS